MSAPASAEPDLAGRRLPPVALLASVALGCVVIGGILLASYAPRRPPLGVPTALCVVGFLLLGAAAALLARIDEFAWRTFAVVYRWALLAYVISAGMIAFAFIHDHVRGAPLAVVLASLVVFATSVPMAISFTVARYATP